MGFFFMLAFIAVAAIYLLIAGFSIRWLLKHDKPKTVIWLAIAFWVLLPTWDTIISLSYHRYVCATAPDLGLTVYHTIPLDPKLFDPKTGRPNIYTRYMELDPTIIGRDVTTKIIDKTIGTWLFKTKQVRYQVIDRQHRQILAEFVDYYAAGNAWWSPAIAPLVTGGTTYQCVQDKYGKGRGSLTIESAFSKKDNVGEEK